MKHANFSPESIDSLKGMLPRGGQTEIAKNTGFDKSYVSNVLSNVHPITADNVVIIEEAQRIIKRHKSEMREKAARLNKFLSDNRA